MKRPLIYLASFLFFLIGCNGNSTKKDLSGTSSDSVKTNDSVCKNVIGLFADTVRFSGKKDTVQLPTKGLEWQFEAITVDGSRYEITPENKKRDSATHNFFQVCDWLTVCRDSFDITLIVASNITNDKRTFELLLQGKGYSARIRGTQDIQLSGDWDDCIGLSRKKVYFGWRGSTVTIPTEYAGWWINAIEVDGVITALGRDSQSKIRDGKSFRKKCDWLTVRATDKKIVLTAESNPDETRSFIISLQAGEYLDTIKGTQQEAMLGDWLDCIGLSKKKITFPAEGGTITVDTKESGWWLNTIDVEGIKTIIELEDNDLISEGEKYRKKCDWLTVCTSYKKIELTVEPNTTGKERLFSVDLQSGDFFDTIQGIQAK